MGAFGLLAMEPADAGERQSRGRRLRSKRFILPSVSGKPYNILNWTRQHMGGRQGACVPETMRFNGRGYENEEWIPNAPINCGEDSPPYYNARTISTGAEVSVWVWAQYEYTDDMAFLKKNYPLMRKQRAFFWPIQLPGRMANCIRSHRMRTRCNGTFMTQPRTYPQCERCSPE